MKLEVNGEMVFDNPDEQIIQYALQLLGEKRDGFAILSSSEGAYIQTAGDPKIGFELEYQDGSLDKHFRCTEPLELSEVIDVFNLYLSLDPQWKSILDWEPLDLREGISRVQAKPTSVTEEVESHTRVRLPSLLSAVISGVPGILLISWAIWNLVEGFIPFARRGSFWESTVFVCFGTISGSVGFLLLRSTWVNVRKFSRLRNDFSITDGVVIHRYKERESTGYTPRYDVYYVTVQFKVPSMGPLLEEIVLKAKVGWRTYRKLKVGERTKIKYANADPYLALLEGEF